MTRKDRAQRHAMAVAHARREDNRREATSGIRAGDRRRVLKELKRERRGCERALVAIERRVRKLVG